MKLKIFSLVFLVVVAFSYNINVNQAQAEYFDLDLSSYSEQQLLDLIDDLQSQVDGTSSKKSSKKAKSAEKTETVEPEVISDDSLSYLDSLSEEEKAEQLVLIEIQKQIEEIAKQIEELILVLSNK